MLLKQLKLGIAKKTRVLNFIGIAALLGTSAFAGDKVYNVDTVIDNGNEFLNPGSKATIKPGVTVTFSGAGAGIFSTGSTIIFEVKGAKFGRIQTITPGDIQIDAQVLFKIIDGQYPPNAVYELIGGDGNIVFYNDPSASNPVQLIDGGPLQLTTMFIPTAFGQNGNLKVLITGSPNKDKPADVVVKSTDGTTRTVFTTNITNMIPISACVGGTAGNNFNYSTPLNIATTMHRFIAGSHRFHSKYESQLTLSTVNKPYTDMLQVLGEGQLPATEINVPTLGTRVWMTGIYNYNSNKLNQTDYNALSKGFQFGVDSTKTALPFGISVAYIATTPTINKQKSGRNRTTQAGVYGGYAAGNFMFFGTLSYGHGNNKLGVIEKQQFSTNSLGASVMASYSHYITQGNVLEPMAGLSYGRSWVPDIKNYMGTQLTSTSKAKRTNSLGSELGLRYSHFIGLDNKNHPPIKVYVQGAWKRDFTNTQKAGAVQLSTGQVMNTPAGQSQPKNMTDLGTGMAVRFDNVDLTLSYGTSFARKVRNHSGMAGVRIAL